LIQCIPSIKFQQIILLCIDSKVNWYDFFKASKDSVEVAPVSQTTWSSIPVLFLTFFPGRRERLLIFLNRQ